MLGLHLYLEGAFAVAIMVTLAIISGFVAGAITGDRYVVMLTGSVVSVLAGVVLAFRLWRMGRESTKAPRLQDGSEQ